MEELNLRGESLKKALHSLVAALRRIEGVVQDEDFPLLRDACIQRFEFSSDTFWKYLRVYLQMRYQVSFDVISPKKVYRELLNRGIIAATDFDELLVLAEDRNLTSHTYNEDLAQEVFGRIPVHCQMMIKVSELLNDGYREP